MDRRQHSKKSANKTEAGFERQKLGDLAAAQVSHWASQLGFVVNEPQRDRRGWDQYFEFFAPSTGESKIPPGMPFAALSCKVQVKGTRTASKAVRVKLSNLLLFSQEPIPCFIMALEFGPKDDEPTNVHLIHVWEEVIGQALERICKLTDRDQKALHKMAIKLSLQPENQLSRPWRDSLGDRIAACIGADLFDYARRKAGLYETVGFADSDRDFKVTFEAPSAEEMYERLSRLAVGLEAVGFVRFEQSRTRFGVNFPDQNLNPEQPGMIRMPPTSKDRSWLIQVFEDDLSNPVELPCIVRSSAQAFPFLPEQYWLLRIETHLMDLLLRVRSNQLTFSFRPPADDQPVELAELYRTSELLERLSSTSGRRVIFRINTQGIQTAKFEFGIAAPAVSLSNGTREFIKMVKSTWLVFRNLDFDAYTRLSISELVLMRSEVFLLEAVFSGMKVRAGCVIAREVRSEGNAAIVTFPSIRFGEHCHIFSVAISGVRKMELLDSRETRVTIDSTGVSLLQRWTMRPEESEGFSFDGAVESATRLLKQQGIEDVFAVPWSDYKNIFAKVK